MIKNAFCFTIVFQQCRQRNHRSRFERNRFRIQVARNADNHRHQKIHRNNRRQKKIRKRQIYFS